MALFKRKKKTEADEAMENFEAEQRKTGKDEAPDPAAEKQRLKKIKNMKKKFDETVWNSVLDVMKTDMPEFVIMDLDDEGDEVVKYMCLGFDTTIVDDFSNKADEDVGSILTAFKSSMDVVIENGLFDNELILILPTQRSLQAIKEFEDVFDLKFKVVYCKEDHSVEVETLVGTEDPLYITIPDIEDMLENNKRVTDMIREVQNRDSIDGGESDVVPDDEHDEVPSDDVSDEEIPYEDEEIPYDDEEIPDEEPDTDYRTAEAIKTVVAEAASKASVAAENIEESKEEVSNVAKDAPKATEQSKASSAASATAQSEAVADKLNRLKNAVQAASDEALKDPGIAQSMINPQNRMATFDMAAMDQYITRKYYSDDLDLEVSSQPFDAMFMQSNPYVPFVEVEGDGWLNGYVNNLRRDANARLAKLHQENLLIMRERFMLILAKHCESIVKAVSTDDPSSRFGYALKTITNLRNTNIEKIKDTAEAYKREKEEDYQKRMRAEIENASNIARTNFINRYGKEHERELKDIEVELRNNIEAEFVSARDNLQMERKNEAKRQLDLGTTEALKLCADEYTKLIAAERKEYVRLQSVITDFQNDNMASDEARAQIMAEEHRRTNEVATVRSEYDSKFDNATKEFEAKLAVAKAEIEQNTSEYQNKIKEIREQHEKELNQVVDQYNEKLGAKDDEINKLNDLIATRDREMEVMVQKYADQDETINQKYRTQIEMLQSERDAWTEEANHMEHIHKYTDKLKITAMIVAIAAALGIGVIIGTAVTSSHVKSNQPVVNYVTTEESTNDSAENATDAEAEAESNETDIDEKSADEEN